MRILAVDPGYERLGIAIVERTSKERNRKETVIFSECFRTSAKLPFEDRLAAVGGRIELLVGKYRPEGLAIENLFLSKNQKTAMRVSEVRGAIIYICKKNGLFVRELTPLQIKMSVTGNGKSTKDQIIKMVNLLVSNPKSGALDDEYDAVAAGLACFALKKNGR